MDNQTDSAQLVYTWITKHTARNWCLHGQLMRQRATGVYMGNGHGQTWYRHVDCWSKQYHSCTLYYTLLITLMTSLCVQRKQLTQLEYRYTSSSSPWAYPIIWSRGYNLPTLSCPARPPLVTPIFFSVVFFVTGANFTDPLTSSILILSFFVTTRIRRCILISFTSSLLSWRFVVGHVSDPYNNVGLTTVPYNSIFPFIV